MKNKKNNKNKQEKRSSFHDNAEPEGLDIALGSASKKSRKSPTQEETPSLYKESLGSEGIKMKDTSTWASQAANSFKVKVTTQEKQRREEREMRFAAARSEQKKSQEEGSDVDDDGFPKGLSSSLSSSRIPGVSASVTTKKRVRNGAGFVGTNRTIEKQYLRLTTFPKAQDVRPLEVLKMSLKHIKEQYIKNEDFDWANEQLKSVRQDITVQGLRTMFVLDVYETHARILLEYGDLNEFNQCQTMIRTLTTGIGSSVDDGLGENIELPYDVDGSPKLLSQLDDQKDEFGGYRLLYALIQNADISMSLTQIRLTVKERTEDQCSQKVSSCLHAMNVIKAVIHSDYRQFFRLYNSAPHLSSFLMDFLVKRIRDAAYERVMVAYRPSIGVEEIRASLNFQDLNETKKFLKQNGAVFIKEKGEPRFWVDCKASRKCSS